MVGSAGSGRGRLTRKHGKSTAKGRRRDMTTEAGTSAAVVQAAPNATTVFGPPLPAVAPEPDDETEDTRPPELPVGSNKLEVVMRRPIDSIGDRIERIRQELRISMSELGRRLPTPVTKGTIHHWKSGLTVMTLAQVEDVARVLNVDPSWLAFGEGTRETVPLSGEIMRGGIVAPPKSNERIVQPPSLSGRALPLAAFRVMTDENPSAKVGHILFTYGQAEQDMSRAVGQEAIVELENGDRLYRTVERSGKPSCVNLVDHRGTVMVDVRPIRLWIVLANIRQDAVDLYRD